MRPASLGLYAIGALGWSINSAGPLLLVMSVMCCLPGSRSSSECLQLTEREARVCVAVCNSPEPVTFSALKTTLGYHQEVVSRILRRLMNHGAIEKVKGRYWRASQ